MTMVIAKNNGNSILMTADSRITYASGEHQDGFKKIKVIKNKYVIRF